MTVLCSQQASRMKKTGLRAADQSPRWSPDGQSILFLSTRGGNSQIWILPMDLGEARLATPFVLDRELLPGDVAGMTTRNHKLQIRSRNLLRARKRIYGLVVQSKAEKQISSWSSPLQFMKCPRSSHVKTDPASSIGPSSLDGNHYRVARSPSTPDHNRNQRPGPRSLGNLDIDLVQSNVSRCPAGK